jgi:hypothetical protein
VSLDEKSAKGMRLPFGAHRQLSSTTEPYYFIFGYSRKAGSVDRKLTGGLLGDSEMEEERAS